MRDFQEQGQVHGQQCQVRRQKSKNGFQIRFMDPARNWEITSKQCIIKQLLDSVFVISGIIKVSVSVISLSLRLRLITITSTLIIPDITKTSSNNCLLSLLCCWVKKINERLWSFCGKFWFITICLCGKSLFYLVHTINRNFLGLCAF